MQIREFSKPITAKQLNESLAQKFGYTINLEQFSDVQLEDARNKLRTKLSQLELSESYDNIFENPAYQKTRLMLDCINQAIAEREAIAESTCPECHHNPCECDEDEDHTEAKKEMKKSKKTDESYVANQLRQRAQKLSVPTSWIEKTISKINLGEADRDELKAELKVRYDLNESQASWMLLEGEETKAETIMATKDMVDRITNWLEDVAAMKAEKLLELLDSIRETQGSDVAQRYNDTVKPALEQIYSTLESTRAGLSQALQIVSGGEVDTMGAGSMDQAAAGLGAEVGGMTPPVPGEGEPGAEEETPLSAPAAEVGREKRESVDYSRRLGLLLASKKK